MTNQDFYQMKMRVAAEMAFKELAGVEPTDEDLREIEKQQEEAWLQQIDDGEEV